jgi:hypothetical protein
MGDPTRPAFYTERLWVPWWAWPVAVAFAAFFSAEIFLGADTALAWIPYAILIPLAAAGLFALGRIRIRLEAGSGITELHVDDAHIPVTYITEVNVLTANAKVALLGPVAEPHVFAIQRPWVRGAVRVVIDDPADPTPYWVISTRRPSALAQAIVSARDYAVATGTGDRLAVADGRVLATDDAALGQKDDAALGSERA